MSNYTASGKPLTASRGIARDMRSEFAAIEISNNSKADIASPALTGTPTAPTAALGTATTQIATTEFVSQTSLDTALPGQAGNAGKFLKTDGSAAGWDVLDPINFSRVTVASHATSADIWDVSGNEINFTGSEVITDFPDAPHAGSSRVLNIAGSPTFTQNSNLTVQGGNTFTAAPGDIVVVTAITASTFSLRISQMSILLLESKIFSANTVSKRGVTNGENINPSGSGSTGLSGGDIAISYGSGVFVASSGGSPNTQVASSVDGLSWTLRTMSGGSQLWLCSSDGSSFLAYDSGGTAVDVSSNGTSWTSATVLPLSGSTGVNNVPWVFGTDTFGVWRSTTSLYRTDDLASSWVLQTLPATPASGAWYRVNGVMWFWVSGTTAYTGSTGLTGSWTARTLPATPKSSVNIWDNFGVLRFRSTTDVLYESTDGINWTNLGITDTSVDLIYSLNGVSVAYATGSSYTYHNGVAVPRVAAGTADKDTLRPATNGSNINVLSKGNGDTMLMEDTATAVFV